MLLYSFARGPLPRHTGAPGDQTCDRCHRGTALNGGGGSAVLTSPTGSTYTAGQTINLVPPSPTPTRGVYGFQAARLTATLTTASRHITAGAQQHIICEDGKDPGLGPRASGPTSFRAHAPFSTNTITIS
jgi:hypothetical protein